MMEQFEVEQKRFFNHYYLLGLPEREIIKQNTIGTMWLFNDRWVSRLFIEENERSITTVGLSKHRGI
jgi:hypothetical protein